MKREDLEEALHAGIRNSIELAFEFSNDLDDQTFPEYLKTVKVAEALRRIVPKHSRIKLEAPTHEVLARHLLFSGASDWPSWVSREGRIDICLELYDPAVPSPIVVIENKRILRRASDVNDDLRRCAEFLRSAGPSGAGSIAVTGVTYLLKMTGRHGVTAEEHRLNARPMLQAIQASAEALTVGSPLNHKQLCWPIHLRVYLDEDDAFASPTGEAPDSHNYPPLTIVGACEVFWRDDREHWLARL